MEEQLINKKNVALGVAENDRRPALGRFWIGVPGRLQDGRCHDVMARVAKGPKPPPVLFTKPIQTYSR